MGDLTVWFQYERNEATNSGYFDWKLKKKDSFTLGRMDQLCHPHNHLCYESSPSFSGLERGIPLLLQIWTMFKSFY